MNTTGLKNNRDYYDAFSQGYEAKRHHGYHAMLDELEAGLVRHIGSGKNVLEAGCGTGLVLARIHEFAKCAWGVDLSGGMLSHAANRGLAVAQGDLTRLPLRDNAVDVVCSFKVLAHVPAIREALAEMARITKPGGRLLLEFYNPYSLRGLIKKLKRPSKIAEHTHDEHVFTRFDSLSQIRSYLPASCRIASVAGVRIWTPAAFIHDIPVVGACLRFMERISARTPLARLAGFIVVEIVVEK